MTPHRGTIRNHEVLQISDMRLKDGEIEFQTEWVGSASSRYNRLSWERASSFKGGMRAKAIKRYAHGNEHQYRRLLAERADHLRYLRFHELKDDEQAASLPLPGQEGSRTVQRTGESDEAFQARLKKNEAARLQAREKRQEKKEKMEKKKQQRDEEKKAQAVDTTPELGED